MYKNDIAVIANIATILVPLIAVGALIVAWMQKTSSITSARRATAYSIYHEYLRLAVANPVLAYPRMRLISADPILRDSYKWFVSSMLLSFEEILHVCPGQQDWIFAIRDQLGRHAEHLERSFSAQRHWKPELKKLILEAIEEQVGRRDRIPPNELLILRRGL